MREVADACGSDEWSRRCARVPDRTPPHAPDQAPRQPSDRPPDATPPTVARPRRSVLMRSREPFAIRVGATSLQAWPEPVICRKNPVSTAASLLAKIQARPFGRKPAQKPPDRIACRLDLSQIATLAAANTIRCGNRDAALVNIQTNKKCLHQHDLPMRPQTETASQKTGKPRASAKRHTD